MLDYKCSANKNTSSAHVYCIYRVGKKKTVLLLSDHCVNQDCQIFVGNALLERELNILFNDVLHGYISLLV